MATRGAVVVLAAMVGLVAACGSEPDHAGEESAVELSAVTEVTQGGWLVPDDLTVWSVDDQFYVAVQDGLLPFHFGDCVAWHRTRPDNCNAAAVALAPDSAAVTGDFEYRIDVPAEPAGWLLYSDDQATYRDVRAAESSAATIRRALSPSPSRGDYEIRELVDGPAILAAFGLCRPEATSPFCTNHAGNIAPGSCQKDSDGTTRCMLEDETRIAVFLGLLHRDELATVAQ